MDAGHRCRSLCRPIYYMLFCFQVNFFTSNMYDLCAASWHDKRWLCSTKTNFSGICSKSVVTKIWLSAFTTYWTHNHFKGHVSGLSGLESGPKSVQGLLKQFTVYRLDVLPYASLSESLKVFTKHRIMVMDEKLTKQTKRFMLEECGCIRSFGLINCPSCSDETVD